YARRVKKVLQPFRLLYRHRLLIAHAVGRDLRYRTAGMAFGMLWLLITPLLLLAVYSVVYIFVFRVRPVAMTEFEYVAYLFCGLVPFLAMSEGLVAGMQSLSAHSVLLTSTVFPVEILAVRSV